MMFRFPLLLCFSAGIAGLFLFACGDRPSGGHGETDSLPITDEAMVAADAKFKNLCAACHGESGKGDGANLTPRPRDYTDAVWQDSVTDQYLADIILKGGPAVGKDVLMPPSPDLKDKPEVIAALVKKIRGFRKQ